NRSPCPLARRYVVLRRRMEATMLPAGVQLDSRLHYLQFCCFVPHVDDRGGANTACGHIDTSPSTTLTHSESRDFSLVFGGPRSDRSYLLWQDRKILTERVIDRLILSSNTGECSGPTLTYLQVAKLQKTGGANHRRRSSSDGRRGRVQREEKEARL
ncbi:hypothetical protein BaRGS_00012759, partial [Batillaria attramentaria]